jgi:hypothetical protein
MEPQDLVTLYLRGQNLEQVQRTDDAAELYEQAVTARFDAAGPYDRLIAIYTQREAYADVARVADAAAEAVRTFDEKHAWYESVAAGAREAAAEPRGADF